jgi:hypothetical protein
MTVTCQECLLGVEGVTTPTRRIRRHARLTTRETTGARVLARSSYARFASARRGSLQTPALGRLGGVSADNDLTPPFDQWEKPQAAGSVLGSLPLRWERKKEQLPDAAVKRTTDVRVAASGSDHPLGPRTPLTPANPCCVLGCARPDVDLVDQRLDTCGRLRNEISQVPRLDRVLNRASQLVPIRLDAHAPIVPSGRVRRPAGRTRGQSCSGGRPAWSRGLVLQGFASRA